MQVVDVAAITAISIVDYEICAPVFQSPLALGADVSMPRATKCIALRTSAATPTSGLGAGLLSELCAC